MTTVTSQDACARPIAKLSRAFPGLKPLLLARLGKAFRNRGLAPWWLRDPRRASGTNDYSWIDIFQRDGFRCVYCGSDLSVSALAVATATYDHVVPRCLFTPVGDASRGVNLVACCAVCNALKGNWHPESIDDPAWQSRAGFIDAARRHIEREVKEKRQRFERYAGASGKMKSIESWPVPRRASLTSDRADYEKSARADLSGRV